MGCALIDIKTNLATYMAARTPTHRYASFDMLSRLNEPAPGEPRPSRYTHDVCKPLLELGSQIRAAFPDGATDTLVTKIMLGVFGSVPAFDTNFKTGFGVYAFGESP